MNQNIADNEVKNRIFGIALLDLRQMKSIDELCNISEIVNVGAILLSDAFKGTIASIPMIRVGGVITVPEGCKLNKIEGTLKISGDFMENLNGDGTEILLVSGDLIITSPFTRFGYESLIVTGDLFVPRGCEQILAPFIKQNTGQIIYIDHENVRMFTGQDRFSKDFFTYIKKPMTMILMGEFLIESDVSVELLQEKVSQIVLMGVLKAEEKKLVPLLLALTEEKYGEIVVSNTLEGES